MSSRRNKHGDRQAYVLREPDYLPVYVGEGLGHLDYVDALELALLRRLSPKESESLRLTIQLRADVRPHNEWRDYRGTSRKTPHIFRASSKSPYICDHCAYRTTRYNNMVKHLENVHHDYATDPRDKSIAVQQGIVRTLKEWKAI